MRRHGHEGRAAGGDAADARATEETVENLGRLFLQMREHFERAIQPLDLPGPCAKALRVIDGAVAMKELGARIQCDASFVTSIADGLEERGLARREPDSDDRRVKKLVLTDKGNALRARLTETLYRDVPALCRLDAAERETFLRLLHKMVGAEGVAAHTPAVEG